MTRQYVGARYVTKIYENSLDPSSAEWEANVNYEPLIMVTFNNGSYLSKKEVPASIGNPASNPLYWVQTGFYNGQITSLQSQIDAINLIIGNINDLDTVATDLVNAINEVNAKTEYVNPKLNYKNYVMLGDSWGVGIYSESGYGWTHYLKELLDYDNCYDYSENSIGFKAIGADGHTFQSLLAAHSSDIADHNNIDCIIVAGGVNDGSATENELNTSIKNFVEYAESEYPNATIYIISCNANIPYSPTAYVYPRSYARAFQYGKHVISIDATGCVCGFLYSVSDSMHLTDDGYKSCAYSIYSILRSESNVYAGSQRYYATYSDSSGKINLAVYELWENGMPTIYCSVQTFYSLESAGYTVGLGNSITLTRGASDKPFNVPAGMPFTGHGRIAIESGGGNYEVGMSITFNSDDTATFKFDADASISGTIAAMVVTAIQGSAPKRC